MAIRARTESTAVSRLIPASGPALRSMAGSPLPGVADSSWDSLSASKDTMRAW